MAHMKLKIISTLFSVFSIFLMYSQDAKNDWITHVNKKEKGFMSVLVNLRYDYAKPNYKNLLIVGTRTNRCFANGYPKAEGLENIYSFSDSIATIVNQLTKNRLVGIITYQCTGFDIYYLKDTVNVRNDIQHFLNTKSKKSKNYFVLERDKKWSYYKKNLLPKDWTDNFFLNHNLLSQLVSEGDNLAIPRKVEYWIAFKKDKNRQRFVARIKDYKFNIDSLTFKKETKLPYTLKVSRKDKIEPNEILKLTALVKLLAISTSGTYDGWGAEPILK